MAESQIFSNQNLQVQHDELAMAFPDWIAGRYPDARNIGDVILRRREVTTATVSSPDVEITVVSQESDDA